MRPWLTGVLALLLTGCGYHLAGENVGLPSDVRSLHVGTITNRSSEHGIEKILGFAIEREIHMRRQFRVRTDVGATDAVLTGIIRQIQIRPVAFDPDDLALRYEIVMLVDLTLTRPESGEILWNVTGLRQVEVYNASSRSVVSTSSQFQRGTLDGSDLPPVEPGKPGNPQFSQIQFAETERRLAMARLVGQTARDVYNQMIEGF
jgi:outer membrane lipopolysaccharide assembly protein LptE/RlpB